MPEPRPRPPFRRSVFLLRTLVGIFIFEFMVIAFTFHKCAEKIANTESATVEQICPDAGGRAETLFGVAIATTLSLLGLKESDETKP